MSKKKKQTPEQEPDKEEKLEESRNTDERRMSGNGKSTPGYISRFRRNNIIWLLVWVVLGVAIFVTGMLIWESRANILTVLAVLMVLPGAKRIVALVAVGRKHSVASERCRMVETTVEPFIYAGDLDLHEYDPEEEYEDEEDESAPEISNERVIPWNVIFTDYIFTSSEKIMMLDFLVVTDRNIYVLPASTNQEPDYVKKYLTTGIRKWTESMDIKFVRDDDELLRLLNGRYKSEKSKPVEEGGGTDTAESADASDESVKQSATDQRNLRERREALAYLKSLAV